VKYVLAFYFLTSTPQLQQNIMPDTILRTRLYRPKITSDIIIRKELLEKLENNTDRPLTLVSAPAGYGKSTIVSSWIEFYHKRAAWVSIDDSNKDFILLLNYIIEAVHRYYPEALKDLKVMINGRGIPPLLDIANVLSLELDQINESILFVLDDFHRIKDETITELFDLLLQHPPVNLHLVLICRRDPDLPLYDLRSGNKINEIRSRELRFSPVETNRFLEKVYGQKIESGFINTINQKIDGWAAGLRLFSSAVKNIDEIEENLSNSKIEAIFTLDSMARRFLNDQTSEGQDFLLKSSILERFCSPLCDYVCFKQSNQNIPSKTKPLMEWMEEAQLFTIPLDEHKKWYRLHHLFRDVLYTEALEKYNPEQIDDLHRSAGEWFAQSDMLEEAISHFVKGNAVEDAI
jgi:LuxR family maltose regulon positive regulatory protein